MLARLAAVAFAAFVSSHPHGPATDRALRTAAKTGPMQDAPPETALPPARCGDVRAIVTRALGVTPSGGTATVRFTAPVGGRRYLGCRLTASGTFRPWDAAQEPSSRFTAAMEAAGWREDPDFTADGPDGTTGAMRTGSRICFFSFSWDGGDDDDTAAASANTRRAPLPYSVEIHCADERSAR
jgi:hypothetical protein